MFFSMNIFSSFGKISSDVHFFFLHHSALLLKISWSLCVTLCVDTLFCSINLYPNANTILQKSHVFSRHSWNYDKLVNLQVEKNVRPCTVLVMNKTFWVSLGYDLCLPLYLMWVWIILYESVVTMYCCLPCRKSKYFQMAISWFLKIIITILFIDFVVYFIIFIYYINTQK